jgi:hypothetical protein
LGGFGLVFGLGLGTLTLTFWFADLTAGFGAFAPVCFDLVLPGRLICVSGIAPSNGVQGLYSSST